VRERDDFRRVYYFRDQRNGGGFERLGDADHLSLAQAWRAVTNRHADITLNGARRIGRSDTFGDLFAQWLERHAKVRKKSWKYDEDLYERHVKSRLGNKVIADLKRRDIIDALDDITDSVTPIQANRSQSLISAVLGWSLAEDKIEENPAHGIRKRAPEVARERVLDAGELKAFWTSLTESPQDNAIRLLVLLGQRRSELAYASMTELAADSWNIPSARTKNSLPHIVPLTPYSRSLFGEGFDFYPTTLSHRVRDVVRELKIDDFRLHDLRHQVATGMASLGIRQDIRDRVLNQITGRKQTVGSRYDQYEYLVEKRDALERWQNELLRIVGSPL
jgi:integrase